MQAGEYQQFADNKVASSTMGWVDEIHRLARMPAVLLLA